MLQSAIKFVWVSLSFFTPCLKTKHSLTSLYTATAQHHCSEERHCHQIEIVSNFTKITIYISATTFFSAAAGNDARPLPLDLTRTVYTFHPAEPRRATDVRFSSVGNRASSLAQQIGIITVWWDICVRKRTNERTTNELMCMCVYVFMVTRTCSAMF